MANKIVANTFDFILKDTAKDYDISFQWNGKYSIKKPDLFKGVTTKKTKNGLEITINANHDSSTDVAGWYQNFVNDDTSMMIHTADGANDPHGLNFAIQGTLTINNQAFKICLGQGSYGGSTNNWHMCSKEIYADKDNRAGFLGEDLYLTQSGHSSFNVRKIADTSDCHDNEFELTLDGPKLTKIDFELKDHRISDHQPFAGVTAVLENGKGIITVKAGRHKTKAVAEWFGSQVGNGKATGCSSIDSFPDALNFAVKGTLTFTIEGGEVITVDDFMLAQGSFADMFNNWWLGGPQMIGLQIPVLSGGVAQICHSTQGLLKKRTVAWISALKSRSHMSMQFVA